MRPSLDTIIVRVHHFQNQLAADLELDGRLECRVTAVNLAVAAIVRQWVAGRVPDEDAISLFAGVLPS